MQAKRIVVCAANRWDDGLIIASPRHFDMTMHNICARVFPDKKYALCDQGFIDQKGIWMDREEAFKVATEAGQLIGRVKTDPEDILFSEDLYDGYN